MDALANPYRRQLLVALAEHDPQDDDSDPLGLLAAAEESSVDTTALLHTHLPKLEAYGFIERDETTHRIYRGPRWDDIEPVVTLLHEHREELPDGWL